MSDGPQPRSEIAGLLDRFGLSPRKVLGQHFLADPNIVRRIVALAGIDSGDRVVEIGAGTGTLTRALAAAEEDDPDSGYEDEEFEDEDGDSKDKVLEEDAE